MPVLVVQDLHVEIQYFTIFYFNLEFYLKPEIFRRICVVGLFKVYGPVDSPERRTQDETMTLNAFLDSQSQDNYDDKLFGSLLRQGDSVEPLQLDSEGNYDYSDHLDEKDDNAGEDPPIVEKIADTAVIALTLSQKVLDLYKAMEPYIATS